MHNERVQLFMLGVSVILLVVVGWAHQSDLDEYEDRIEALETQVAK